MTEASSLLPRFLTLKDLAGRDGRTIADQASEAEREAIAAAFDMIELQTLEWKVAVRRFGVDGWRISGEIRARLLQKCVVSLQPVGAKLFESFQRDFTPDAADPDEDDIMVGLDEDDPPEPLGAGIDLGGVVLEHFALGVDPYPRTRNASFETARSAPPNVEPLSDEAIRPFAALAALKTAPEQKE